MKVLIILCSCFSFSFCFSQAATNKQSAKADSFFFASSWQNAGKEYEKLLASTGDDKNAVLYVRLGFCYQNMKNYAKAVDLYKKAEANLTASAQLKQTLYTRLSKTYALMNDEKNSLVALDSAVAAGYFNFLDADTAKAFDHMRNSPEFKKLRDKIYFTAYPCMADPHAREFDFWVGEWDAYVTGTKQLQGKSSIQLVSGGCLILENWTSVAQPYSGKSMNFIDSDGKWKQVWVGAGETKGPQVYAGGEYKDSAMRFSFTITNANGKTVQGKFTFFNQGPDQVRQLQQTSNDDGKTWQTVYDFTYIRRK